MERNHESTSPQDLSIDITNVPSLAPLEWKIVNEPGAVRRLARKLERETPGLALPRFRRRLDYAA